MKNNRILGPLGIVIVCLLIDNAYPKTCKSSVKRYQKIDGKFNEKLTPIESFSSITATSCSKRCKESIEPTCHSFNFNTKTGHCLIYNIPLDSSINNYRDKDGSQNYQLSYQCDEKPEKEARDLVPGESLTKGDIRTTMEPERTTNSLVPLIVTTEYISTTEPDVDCIPGWGLLYPILIACAVIIGIVLFIIAACCIHKHCEKKRKEGYRPFQPRSS